MLRQIVFALLFLAPIGPALAHSALISCYREGESQVLCEAGYSDGASSAGQAVHVFNDDQRLILDGVFDAAGTFIFDLPEGGFYVEFEGDSSHIATFYGEDLT